MPQSQDQPRRRRSRQKSNAPDTPGSSRLRDSRGSYRRSEAHREDISRSSESTAHYRGGADRSHRPSRAASPSVPAPAPEAATTSIAHTDFGHGEDFIAFDFSGQDEQDVELPANHSPSGKDKSKEPNVEDRYGQYGQKRSASHMEAEDDVYVNKKQRMDAASRLTPWARDVDWQSCSNLAELIHNEVEAFVTYISPTPQEHEVRCMVVANITRTIQRHWPDARVLAFGSLETKLYLPLGDIDLVVQSPSMDRYEKRQILYTLAHVIRKGNITSNVTVVAKAKVPIIKFVTNLGRFSIDISLNQDNGIVAVRLVNGFLHQLPALQPLVMVIKLFLSQRSMNEVYTGGLGSYSIVCMVISFLQMHPKIRSGEIDPSKNLGVLVIEFFELYGHYFNYDNTGISIRDGGTYFNKQARGWLDSRQTSLLSIEDPNDISNDISKNSYNITRVRKTLAGAHEILTTAALMRARVLLSKAQGRYTSLRHTRSRDYEFDNPSILSSILGVTQETLNHRRLVRQLFEQGTLQTSLGLPLSRPTPVIVNQQPDTSRPRVHSKSESTNRFAEVVESAWGEADMDLSDTNEEPRRLASPEVDEESRYFSGNPRKRRKLDTNGKVSNQDAFYVPGSDQEEFVVSPLRRPASDSGRSTPSFRDAKSSNNKTETRRAYWASKGMSGGDFEDSD